MKCDGLPDDAHLAGCPSCRRDMEALDRIEELLRTQPRIEWPRELTGRILERARRRPAGFWIPLAAAALFLGTVFAVTRPRPAAPEPVAIDRDALADHVRAVELLAAEPAPDGKVLRIQAERLGLQEAEDRLRRSPVPEPIRLYLDQSSLFVNGGGSNRDLQTTAVNLALHYDLSPRTHSFTSTGNTDPTELYAIGLLQYRTNGGNWTQTMETVAGTSSSYSAHANLQLGRNSLQNGDPVQALAYYSSIGDLAAENAGEIRKAGAQAGPVFVGDRALSALDDLALAGRVRTRSAFAIVASHVVTVLGPREHVDSFRGVEGVQCIRGRAVVDLKAFRHDARVTPQAREVLRIAK